MTLFSMIIDHVREMMRLQSKYERAYFGIKLSSKYRDTSSIHLTVLQLCKYEQHFMYCARAGIFYCGNSTEVVHDENSHQET